MKCWSCHKNEAGDGLYCDTCNKTPSSLEELISSARSGLSSRFSSNSSFGPTLSSSSSSSLSPRLSSSSSSSSSFSDLARDENGHPYESAHQFRIRTGRWTLYRVVRTIGGERRTGPGDSAMVKLPIELDIKTGMQKLQHLINISRHNLPGNFTISSAIQWTGLSPANQVSGEYATQYISTGSKQGALLNCLKSYNSGAERGARLRGITYWDPVIEINLLNLPTENNIRIYDMTAGYIQWPTSSISSSIAGNAQTDAEVLIHGVIPRGALTAFCTSPGDIAVHGLTEGAINKEELFRTLFFSTRGKDGAAYVVNILQRLADNMLPRRGALSFMYNLLSGTDKRDCQRDGLSKDFMSALSEVFGEAEVEEELVELDIKRM